MNITFDVACSPSARRWTVAQLRRALCLIVFPALAGILIR
jgi:hypothetical protein